jgi:acyl-CoA synthetase (NDP forming)
MDFSASRDRVAALVSPRNVVIVGASDRPGNWALRAWKNLQRYKYPGNIHLINPRRDEILGQRCYPDFKSLPEPPDHLLVVVPAPAVPDLLVEGAAAGARSATVFSSGFGEAFDADGAKLGARLRDVIARTGLGVSGPNCMGNICKPARFVTLTEDRELDLAPGPVALVGQSGGVMIFVNHALEERGLPVRYLITSGNEAGLQVADYIAFFASEPELKVIIVYVEAIADLEKFKAACRLARAAGKAIVAIKLGQSEAGRSAALAHTGSLAGSVAAFDAVAADIGVIRADNLDDAVEVTELLAYTGAVKGRQLGAVTLSGAYRGLMLDAAERNHVSFPTLAPETVAKLEKVLGVGSLISNPIDGGFGVLQSADTYRICIEALQQDPNIDMVILQEPLPREAGSPRREQYIRLADAIAAEGVKKPIAFITMNSHGQTDYSRALRQTVPHVSFLQEANKTLRVIEAVVRCHEAEAIAATEVASNDKPAATPLTDGLRARAQVAETAFALDEVQSKALLAAYGVPISREAVASTPTEAVAAAQRIGFPVVLKAVSAKLLHKSDVGAVALNLADAEAVKAAWVQIEKNLARHGAADGVSGMLVSEMVRGGHELVLGLHRDPEMGLVAMAGSGGVLLELIRDVAFAAPPITPAKARDMIARTHAGRLIAGFRGTVPLDIDALVQALVALGRVARDLADIIESVDINPFLLKQTGGVAVDALVVIRPLQRAKA